MKKSKKTKQLICQCGNNDMYLFMTKKGSIFAQCNECLQESIISVPEPEKEEPKKRNHYLIIIPKNAIIENEPNTPKGKWTVKEIYSK